MAEVIHAKKGGSLQHLRLTRLLEKPEKTHELSAQEEAEHKALVQAMSEPPKTQ